MLVSIGLPIYNAEKFLRVKFESLSSQTFQDYEIIVSDNGSIDSTPQICEEYLQKDNRIRYFRQQQNMGVVWNYNFVLQQARGKYFLWTAADDLLLPEFIEKNLKVIQSKENIIGCVSNMKVHAVTPNKLTILNKYLKKIGIGFRPFWHFPITGPYRKKVSLYLKKVPWHFFYGIYKTEVLQTYSLKRIVGFDGMIILHALKYGDIETINDSLFDAYASGRQSEGMIQQAEKLNNGTIFEKIFPFYPLSLEIKKMLGTKIFIQNIHHIIRLNLDGLLLIFVDVLFRLKYRIFTGEQYSKKLSSDL